MFSTGFLFYFGLLLVSFVLMTHVYTFFELLSDILKNSIPMSQVAKYLFYLTPKLVYRFDAGQRAGSGAGYLRHSHQEQRSNRDEGVRRQPVSARDSGVRRDALR